MKRRIFGWLWMGCLLAGIVGCSENLPEEEPIPWGPDNIWAVPSISFIFHVLDEDGKDLLNPDTRDDVASNRITATFREKEYVLNDSVYADTDLPFKGLRKHQQLYNDLFYLTFGELDGMEAYEDEELVLDWGNGQKDVVTFTSKMVMVGGKPTFVRDYKLNGEVVDGERTFPIRKTSYPVFWLVKPLEF